MQEIVCHIMQDGEILNAEHPEYPLYQVTIYGSRIDAKKLSKRLSSSIQHLPLRLAFHFEFDVEKALEHGITKDPTLTLDSKIFLEGLVQTETITKAFEEFLQRAL